MIARLSKDAAKPKLTNMVSPKIDKSIFKESAKKCRERQQQEQELAIDMLEANDQLHVEAMVESARNVNAWKEFVKGAAGQRLKV